MPRVSEAIDGAVTTVYNEHLFPWALRAEVGDPNIVPSHTHTVAEITNLGSTLSAYQLRAERNVANGYAGLNAAGRVAGTQQTYGTTAQTAMEGNDERVLHPIRLLTGHGRVIVGHGHALWGPERDI